MKAFRLPSMKRNKPGECLFGEHLDGWMRRGFKISHWKFLSIIFFGVKGTPSSIFFFLEGGEGRRRGATVGDPFFSVQLFVICAAGS